MTSVVDDIFGDLPAAKEPEKHKKKAKKLKPRQDTFYRTPLKPAHLLKGILKPPTPITTTPKGHQLNADEGPEAPHDADSGLGTTTSSSGTESAPIGPSLSTGAASDDSGNGAEATAAKSSNCNGDNEEDDKGEPDDDVAAREKALLAEIALIKAQMAASKAKAHLDSAEVQSSPRAPSVESSQPSRKRRVSFLMDQPKKRVTVDLDAVFSKITKALSNDKKFGKAAALLKKLIGSSLDPTNSDKFMPALKVAFSNRARLHSHWARGAVMEMSEALDNKADYFDPSDKVEVKLWVLDGLHFNRLHTDDTYQFSRTMRIFSKLVKERGPLREPQTDTLLQRIIVDALQHCFVMYKSHNWAKVQVETLVEDVKYARQSFSEEIRSVLDDM
eukprot:INCI2930.1.p1 GENE.INCI2930.1~~INCI2930.1.p1  ORF type:complete len:388 (-),score=82.77 INCI2930.1:72-1235(-)